MKSGLREMTPRYFKAPKEFRAWLERNHRTESVLVVGFFKVSTGKPSITWPQSVDEALSFGWIDGVRRSLGDEAYTIRFTPRKSTSIWSAVNIKRIGELIAEGRVAQAGLDAFAKRDEKKSAIYSYERAYAQLDAPSLAMFMADVKAWAFYESQPPFYRRLTAHWIGSAKRLETRARRLEELIACSRNGERIPALAPPTHAARKSTTVKKASDAKTHSQAKRATNPRRKTPEK
jgi:uncharacterized protein YdeI (YjbR/CyaY-like superfamily)